MNRLAESLSPYLLAHREDPVDWQPWDEAALALARREDRPILLSIGYASCHWCHVMQHESFQDETIARRINEGFVAIKVDREELPDVDQVYQSVCQVVTGQGGWPLTVFLTPDLRPFLIGTYYPPTRRYGRPGFAEVLASVLDAYRTRRDEVEQVAGNWAGAARVVLPPPSRPVSEEPDEAIRNAVASVLASYDGQRGGFGGAPKFPQGPNLALLLRARQLLHDARADDALRTTLRAMMRGGVHDQIAGGFHRYAVDAAWQVPHFEKMLEDQALLAPLYTEFWLATGETWAREVAETTLRYVDATLSSPEGGFYISQDADSPGGEGAYYRFSLHDLDRLLGADAHAAVLHFGLDDPGVAEEGVLQLRRDVDQVATALGEQPEVVRERLGRSHAALAEARRGRPAPGVDRKVLAGATGLAISAFARLGSAEGRERWLLRARRAASFALERLRRDDGSLSRRFYEGRAGIPGYLEDYAGLAQGLLDLYLAGGDLGWLDAALRLCRKAIELFWDRESGVLYSAPLDAKTPLARPVDGFDGAKPAAQSRMLRLASLLSSFDEDLPAAELAESVLRTQQALWSDHPAASPSLVEARDVYLRGPREVTIAAAPGDPQAAHWMQELRRLALPDLLPTWIHPGRDFALWRGKRVLDGQATVYACRLGACSAPLHDLPSALEFLGQS